MAQQSKDIQEQLAPSGAKLRGARALIRPVSQITLRLKHVAGHDRFAETVNSILRWMNKRAGRKLPDEAWQGRSFELSDIGSQRTAATALSEPRYWAARLDDADKKVPLRTWVTEIGVGVDVDSDVLFGTRLICTTRGDDEPFNRSVPGFVKAILATGAAEFDGELIANEPRLLSSESDIEQLIALLERPSRLSDVVLFALPKESSNPNDAAASARLVHQETKGAAHVLVLTGPASFFLTDRVGRELSVFHQGVRIYKPRFKSWIDQPSNHPLLLPERIATWEEEGPSAFERWLINQVFADSIHTPDRELRLPSFNTVRQLAAQLDRDHVKKSGGSGAELMKLYEDDNEQLRKELREQKDHYDGLLATADRERETATQEANAAKAQSFNRLHRIRALEQQIVGAGRQQETTIPTTLDGIEEWCKEHLVGSVELVNRAFQGIRKSEYHDPTFIYKALLLLRDYYVPMRIEGGADKRSAYEEALANLQLEDTATGDGVKYSKDLYSIQYGGQRRALDRHLKGRDSRDRRYGFRLYYFWDDEGQVIVVGWLPSHLDNRAS